MRNLCLCVTSHNLKCFTPVHIFFILLFAAHYLNTLHEHPNMHSSRHLIHAYEDKVDKVLISQSFLLDGLIDSGEILDRFFDSSHPTFVQVIEVVRKGRIFIKYFFKRVIELLSIQKFWQLLGVKADLLPLLVQNFFNCCHHWRQ